MSRDTLDSAGDTASDTLTGRTLRREEIMGGSGLGTVFMARHGETEANREQRYAGRTMDGLTDRGRTQVQDLGAELASAKIEAIWTSELPRARESADIIAGLLRVPVSLDPRLTELLMGPWEGLRESDVSRRYPEQYRMWLEAPDEVTLDGRETLDAVAQRVGAAVLSAAAHLTPVLLMTHVAPIRVAILQTMGLPLRLYKRLPVANADCFRIGRSSGQVWRLGARRTLRDELFAPTSRV